MPEPIFERIDSTPTEPPAHLANATPAEIHAYWMNRERQVREEAHPPNTPPNPPTPPARPTTIGTPAGMTPGQALTLIAGAKLLASQGKEHWQRFLTEVSGIMGQMTPEQQMDANMWETVYEKVLGMHMSDLVKEAREAALHPPITESSTPASPASQPRTLTANELHVVDQLRRAGALAVRKDATGKNIQVPFDSEAYIAADERRQKGVFPLTFANY